MVSARHLATSQRLIPQLRPAFSENYDFRKLLPSSLWFSEYIAGELAKLVSPAQFRFSKSFLPPTSGDFPALAGLAPGAPNPYFTLQTTGTAPARPGIGRNSFRGPRYQDVDLSIVKEFAITEGARIQLRMTAYNAFNKLNLAPFSFGSTSTIISSQCCGSPTPAANSLFGTATTGLAGRVLELQGRISF